VSDKGNARSKPPVARVALRRRLRLEVLAQAPDPSLVQDVFHGPLIDGRGLLDYACGQCDSVLCNGISSGMLPGVVIRCWCGALNRVPRKTTRER
jgi:hypothetical protein